MLSHTHLGTCGSGSGMICHSLFQESRKTKDEASNATKTQMSRRSQHGAGTAVYRQPPLRAAFHSGTSPTRRLSVCAVPAASEDPGPSVIQAFARWEREHWHLPKGLPEGSWRGSGMEKRGCISGKLETIRETPRNPRTSCGESLGDRRGLHDLRKAQRPLASKRGASRSHAPLHLWVLTSN